MVVTTKKLKTLKMKYGKCAGKLVPTHSFKSIRQANLADGVRVWSMCRRCFAGLCVTYLIDQDGRAIRRIEWTSDRSDSEPDRPALADGPSLALASNLLSDVNNQKHALGLENKSLQATACRARSPHPRLRSNFEKSDTFSGSSKFSEVMKILKDRK